MKKNEGYYISRIKQLESIVQWFAAMNMNEDTQVCWVYGGTPISNDFDFTIDQVTQARKLLKIKTPEDLDALRTKLGLK